MKLAILFWFYKEPEVCLNHLKLIKKHNPNSKIFGLYGGIKKDAKQYKAKLNKYLDDFHVSELCDKPRNYKWIHGDLMILDWYQNKGISLTNWDSVAVVQWDALILGDIKKQLPGIKKGEIFISGTRILDNYIEERWNWTKKGDRERPNYLKFQKHIEDKYNYKNKLLCSLFIFQVFPKNFFDKWSTVENKELGMLEYKIPTYAKIFNIPIYRRDLGVWWFNEKAYKGETPMNAMEEEISENLISTELKKEDGFRIFHPYFKKWGAK
ncbi:hypothetical protein HN784_05095 [bacterium]|jgi:hypothetical protein|nr:hypothetical protein [bacterium]MBT4598189.1 hypothetical protein [bacterium]MBT6753787.1 hypothetical protein [bacterium]MBT7037500.1 hypothetical protein [bacterium]MBT7432191.1 hypothetical protein [bacterium]